MCTALRAHENPAVEVAAREAVALNVRLRIATVVCSKLPHMNARRVVFALEGMANVQCELAQHGTKLEVCQCECTHAVSWLAMLQVICLPQHEVRCCCLFIPVS